MERGIGSHSKLSIGAVKKSESSALLQTRITVGHRDRNKNT